MIYPSDKFIGPGMAKIIIRELYWLPEIKPWHVLAFAEKYNLVITSKKDIEYIAKINRIEIHQPLKYDKINNTIAVDFGNVCGAGPSPDDHRQTSSGE